MSTTILPDRLERLLSNEIHLRHGKGAGANDGNVDVCLVQAADWLVGGEGQTDHPECVSRKIADYCIGLNDSRLFAEHRDLLKPYAAKIVGTAGPDGEREVRLAYLLADYAVRVFAPIWLRADPAHRFDAYAKACEECAPIVDEESRVAAKRAAASAAHAASAASAAYAASAADAADAAYAAHAADAASAADAAYAAYAAYAAHAASAAYAAHAADAASAADAAYAAYAAYAASAASAAHAAYAAHAADAASAADAAYAAYAASAAYAAHAADAASAERGDFLRALALECLDALIAVPLSTGATA